MGGQGLASLLSGILGGVGNQIQLDKARKLQTQVADLQAERQAFESVMRDANATPQAKAAALRGILASTQQQPSGKGSKGKQQQPDMLSQITQGIIGMPSEPFVDPEQKRVQQEKDIEKVRFEEFQKEQAVARQQAKEDEQSAYELRVKRSEGMKDLTPRELMEYRLTGKIDRPLASSSAAPKPFPNKGRPAGFTVATPEGQKNISPGDPEWTDDLDTKLKLAQKSYDQSQDTITNRVVLAANLRKETFQREYPVYRSDGSLGFATPQDIARAPRDFAPISQALQTKNREGLFKEIDYTQDQVKDALNKLPEDGFDAKARAQMALIMKSPDIPTLDGAFNTFLNSSLAKSLTDEQIAYVTSLVSLHESAMALRSIGGMGGGGSDLLRRTISAMLPGPGTPSRKYAQRQLDLFRGEVNQLRTSVPTLPGQENSGTIKMRAPNGEEKDVPASEVDHYKALGAKVVE